MKNIYLILLVFFVSCGKDITVSPVQIQQYPAVFSKHRVNFAWGLTNHHWIIDSMGNVRMQSKKDTVVFTNEVGTRSELLEYSQNFDSVVFNIKQDELTYYMSLIQGASEGEVKEMGLGMNDFGGLEFDAYYIQNDSFEKVLLYEKSDLRDAVNQNTGAMAIHKWMAKVEGDFSD